MEDTAQGAKRSLTSSIIGQDRRLMPTRVPSSDFCHPTGEVRLGQESVGGRHHHQPYVKAVKGVLPGVTHIRTGLHRL